MQLQTQLKTASQPSFTPVRYRLLQRKCACGGTPGLDGECAERRRKQLQRRSTDHPEPSTAPPIVHEVLRSPGQPLDANTRAFMESRFGHDFSQVKVHVDAKAAESAQAVNAWAYTVGRDVVFEAGRYAPMISEGRRLLAHELTHVVQQGENAGQSVANLEISNPADTAERQAENTAQAIFGGRAFTGMSNTTKRLARFISNLPQTAETGISSAVYRMKFSQIGGLSMEDLLAKLNELSREELLDLMQHASDAADYGRGRLELAMDAVWHRNFSRAVMPEFRVTLPHRMNQVIPYADQQRALMRFFDAKTIQRGERRTAARAEDARKTPAQTADTGQGPIPAEQLSAFGTEEQTTFKCEVYNAQIKRALRAKTFFPGLPAGEMEEVEQGYRLRKDAAQACRALLAQARADLKQKQEEGDELALQVKSIGLGSAYRDPQRDFQIWDGLFEKYYNETQAKRAELDGGEHGEAAVHHLAVYISSYKAVPGFSNHTSGIAVDFVTTEGKETLGANKSQNARWKTSWLHQWLVVNAATFGFKPLSSEAWHWDYRGAQEGEGRPDSGQ